MAFNPTKATRRETSPPPLPQAFSWPGTPLLVFITPSTDVQLLSRGAILTHISNSTCSKVAHNRVTAVNSSSSSSCSQCCLLSTQNPVMAPVSLQVQAQYLLWQENKALPFPSTFSRGEAFLSCSLLHAELLGDCLANRKVHWVLREPRTIS